MLESPSTWSQTSSLYCYTPQKTSSMPFLEYYLPLKTIRVLFLPLTSSFQPLTQHLPFKVCAGSLTEYNQNWTPDFYSYLPKHCIPSILPSQVKTLESFLSFVLFFFSLSHANIQSVSKACAIPTLKIQPLFDHLPSPFFHWPKPPASPSKALAVTSSLISPPPPCP